MKNEHLDKLRQAMRKHQIDAILIPGSDPHASEYIAPHWQQRLYISGFTGSAGTIVVTSKKAALWTDSRYFLQAEQQLQGTGIALMKDGLPETPTVEDWILDNLDNKMVLSVDATMFTIQTIFNLQQKLNTKQITLNTTLDLVDEIWDEQPELPHQPILCLNAEITGLTAFQKIEAVTKQMKTNKHDWMLLSTLDDIAWLLNIRARDIEFNPVVISYLLITPQQTILYIDQRKIDTKAELHLKEAHVEVKPYLDIFKDLKHIHGNIAIDFSKANYALLQAINKEANIINTPSPVVLLKSLKNQIELKGIKLAMLKDGVALTKFCLWLYQNIGGGKLSEISVMEKLYQCRAEQKDFFSESFCTIAAYQEHGAIVHYEATPETNVTLHPNGLLLLDSGAQYTHGTTDITRTFALGPVTKAQQKDYTLVLKGHIALANAQFPYGTRGVQLDVLARQFLWKEALQFGHGTGHGVGHFLCVHEGPQSIRMNENPTILQPGMVTSNEPGLYRAGQYGIRIENLISVDDSQTSTFGRFLCFDTLTLFPYDRNAMDLELLTNQEIEWIDQYHQKVYDLLSPYLNSEEKEWLHSQTLPLI